MTKDYTQTLDQPFAILQQYQKDLSFEGPGILYFLQGHVKGEPDYNMDWTVTYDLLDGHIYEVLITMNITAKHLDKTLYVIELVYGAIVSINEKYAQHHPGLLSVDVPHHLFPFLRFMIEQQVRHGGFPYLLLPLVNFQAEFIKKQQAAQEKEAQDGKNAHPKNTPDEPAKA